MGFCIDRLKIELAAEEQDSDAEVVKAAESASIGLDGLDDRVEALGSGIGDAVLGVVEQALAMPTKHLDDLLDRLNTAAHGTRAPGVEVGSGRFRVAVVPERRKALLERPGPAGLEVGLVQVAKRHSVSATLVGHGLEPSVLGARQR